MRYHHVISFDAPAPAVYAMLIDPAYQDERSRAGDPVHAEFRIEAGPGDGATITVQRTMAISPPGFIKKFTGDRITITETQAWRDSGGSLAVRDGTLSVRIANQPGDVTGTLRLDEVGGATTVTIDAEIVVRVPLIGGKVESYVGGILDKLMAKDLEIGSAWLARA